MAIARPCLLMAFALAPIIALPQRPTCKVLPNITAFLLDLDGTIYIPGGLISGASTFVHGLEERHIPFVFLSNSGAKGAEGVRAKFLTPPYVLQDKPIKLDQAHTAAEAAATYLVENAPHSARIFVIQGMSRYGTFTDSFLRVLKRLAPPSLLKSWHWRTDLTDAEVEQWAADSSLGSPTYVVLSHDGQISDESDDPVTGRAGYADWSLVLLIICYPVHIGAAGPTVCSHMHSSSSRTGLFW